MYDFSGELTVILITIWCLPKLGKVWQKVNKQYRSLKWKYLISGREELRPRVFESRVLKNIFKPKQVKVTGEWGKLYGEVLNALYSSPISILDTKWTRMRWVRHVARM
jgi:hypothetical protein